MDIEKLIERLKQNTSCWTDTVYGYADLRLEAATALSTLKAENEKLRAESIMHHNAADNYWHELNEYRQERNEALTELEQVKRDLDAAVKCIKEIEDALNFQRMSAIGLRISEWCGKKED